MGEPFYTYTATRGIEEIKAGRLTATEWTRSCIDRIEATESTLKAWAFFNKDCALSQSAELDKKLSLGADPSPLFGAPIGIKDIFNTYDMPTRRGSPVYEEYHPQNDARVVARLRWAHGIVAGKTASDEFAVHWPTETVNPHNPDHTPGGSSSGSAASVASGMVPLALSSQTLGSTIRPASYCGIYGFKPSFGLLPRTGMFKTTDTLDHVAFMSRSIEDTRLMLDTLRLSGPDHPFIHEKIDLRKTQNEKQKPWKIARLIPPSWVHEEGYANVALDQFADQMQQAGVFLTDVRLPSAFEEAMVIHDTIYNVTLSYYFKEEYGKYQAQISPWFKEMVEKGMKISTNEYRAALESQTRLTEELEDCLNPFDALITLSAGGGEAPKGRFSRNKPDTCLIWTLCRVPALNVPLFQGPQNLPFGCQIIANRYDDYSLLDFVSFLKRRGLAGDAPIARVKEDR